MANTRKAAAVLVLLSSWWLMTPVPAAQAAMSLADAGEVGNRDHMSLRRAIRDRLLSRPAVMAAHAVALVVLSRLLSPTDFGLFALAAVVHQIVVAIADLGIKSQLLKTTTLDPRHHGEAFGLALLSAFIVGVAFLGVIHLLPDEVVSPRLDPALWILAAMIFLGPLELLFNIPLMQSMRFGLVSVINVAGAWVRCVVSIVAAVYGAGPAALAAGFLAEQIVSFALFACARRGDAMPTPRITGWYGLIADGLHLSSAQVVRRLGDLGMMGAISAVLGVATLGIYNRADQIIKLFDKVFIDSISPVVLPAFVQAIEHGHRPAAIYLKKVELLSALIWPAFAMLALLAEPLCRVVLGPGWPAAPAIVQFLAVIGIVKPFTKMNQALFIALGELRLGTRLDILHHVTRATFASAGALISLEAACVGLILAQITSGVWQTLAFGRLTGVSKKQLSSVALSSGLLMAFAVGSAAATLYFVPNDKDLLQLFVAGMAGAAGFAIAAVIMRHALYFEARKALKSLSF
ncbi:MAG: oligosaccharide flippase family protein [Paracoccaceae bacterium]|nr:oligosaccharide flippase family protein [Paracoccaceae bacterium]